MKSEALFNSPSIADIANVNIENLPIRAHAYTPSHTGYNLISEQEYLDVKAGVKNRQEELVYTGNGYKKVNKGAGIVHKRQYLVRARKERGKPAPAIATERVTYYIK